RQPGQLRRQPLLDEDALHVREVSPGEAVARAEALADAVLPAQPPVIGRTLELVLIRIVLEQVVDALIGGSERRARRPRLGGPATGPPGAPPPPLPPPA